VFRPGDQILFRFVWPWKVFSAKGTTVIEHSQERVALWTAPGTPVKGPPGLRVPISRIAVEIGRTRTLCGSAGA